MFSLKISFHFLPTPSILIPIVSPTPYPRYPPFSRLEFLFLYELIKMGPKPLTYVESGLIIPKDQHEFPSEVPEWWGSPCSWCRQLTLASLRLWSGLCSLESHSGLCALSCSLHMCTGLVLLGPSAIPQNSCIRFLPPSPQTLSQTFSVQGAYCAVSRCGQMNNFRVHFPCPSDLWLSLSHPGLEHCFGEC